MTTAFADDPVATHSAQFPLAGVRSVGIHDLPSADGVRPWNLRGMAPVETSWPLPPRGTYDPVTQTSLGHDGLPVAAQPTAKSITHGDGDEGPSEDWQYDAVPDNPYES